MRGGIILSIVILVCNCGEDLRQNSRLDDIFTNDAQTRHVATAAEQLWTVSMGGCTGSMLSIRYMLTANHCSPRQGATYSSGGALANGSSRDLRVVGVAESSSKFDYSIVEVSWIRTDYWFKQKYSPYILTDESELTTGRDDDPETTKLMTVGFPTDKNGAHHAIGYAKAFRQDSLIYNIGIINGNSGGAVWRESDKMLVSQTNFGPNSHGQSGWRDNAPEDSSHWNGGGRMDKIWAQSKILKEIFPEGDNIYVDSLGNLHL